MWNGLLILSIVRALTLLTLSIILSGCGEKEIAGQMFVVTQAKENIKLALVTVGAIPQEEFDQYLKARQIEKQKQQRLLSSKYSQAKAMRTNDGAMTFSELDLKYGNHKGAKLEALNAEVSETVAARDEARAVIAEYEVFDKAEFLLAGIPSPKFTSKTDADGKFALKLPSGKYVITANTSRDVFGSTETYHWLVSVDTSSADQLLMLSNDNLLETKCNACVKF